MNISTLFYFANLGIFCGCITLVITYILAQTMNIMQDKPNKSVFKLHTKNTPLCGGISIFIAYIVVVLGGIEIQNISYVNRLLSLYVGGFYEYAGLHFYIACCVVLCAGIIKDISNKTKLQLMFCIQIFGFCIFYILLYLLNIQHDYNMVLIFISSCFFSLLQQIVLIQLMAYMVMLQYVAWQYYLLYAMCLIKHKAILLYLPLVYYLAFCQFLYFLIIPLVECF